MKKIILGCAAVLLSLGLLAGCNNEESDKAVSITVDTAATVVVGESLALPYTVEPEKAEIEVLNNHEEYVTAVAQEGTLYLEGLSAGSATVTLVGTYKKYTEANVSIAVSVVTKATEDSGPGEEEPGDTGETGPGEQVIALSVDATLDLIENGDPATIVPVVTPEGAEISSYEITDVVFTTDPEPDDDAYVISVTPTEEGYVVTPSLQGTANIVFTASLDGYDNVSETTAVTVHEEGWTETEPGPETESLTYVITLGSLGTAPEGTVLYAAGDFNGTLHDGGDYYDWGEPIELENNGDATYNLVLDFLPENNRSFEILATNEEYDNDETGSDLWNHVLGDYTITGISDDSNGTTIEITISTEYDCWEEGDEGENPVFKALGEDETIYVVFLDSTGGNDHTIVNQSDMSVGTYTVVDNKGNATFGASNDDSCTPTMTTTSQSRVAFYTEEVTVPANASVEFDLYVTNNSVTYHETSPDLEVPEAEEGKTNVLVLGPWFEGWLSATPTNNEVWWGCNWITSNDNAYENSGLGWQTMDDTAQISDFVASISYTYPW